MEFRESEYFNSEDTYLFENTLGQQYESKVELDKGVYWTTNPKHCFCKATTLKCKKI